MFLFKSETHGSEKVGIKFSKKQAQLCYDRGHCFQNSRLIGPSQDTSVRKMTGHGAEQQLIFFVTGSRLVPQSTLASCPMRIDGSALGEEWSVGDHLVLRLKV
jgi:hypothetical protein